MEHYTSELLHIAVWLIGLMGGTVIAMLAYGGQKLLERLEKQDETMEAIKDLLTSEVEKLREGQFALSVGITRLEAHVDITRNTGF